MVSCSSKIQRQYISTIKEHALVSPGAHIVLGLSGGPDSVCLFDLLIKLRDSNELPVSLHAVHVNHQLRGEDAERDQEYVEKLCLDNDVPLDVVVFDCAATAKQLGITTEEAGRIKRYEAFDDAAEKIERELEREVPGYEFSEVIPKNKNVEEYIGGIDADLDKSTHNAAEEERADIVMPEVVIAVAHNYDDQAETIMFRLMRGTGPDGLSGMEYARTDERGFKLIRPLLDCKKSDIIEYCSENGLTPRIDKTNEEPIYSRNVIRREVFPFLEKYSPNFKDALIRLGNIARSDKQFMQELATEVLMYARKNNEMSPVANDDESCYRGSGSDIYDEKNERGTSGRDIERGYILLDGDKLRKIAPPIRRRVISLAAAELGLTEDLATVHFEMADEVILSGGPSAGIDLPHGYRLSNIYENVRISAPDESGYDVPPGEVLIVPKEQFDHMIEEGSLIKGRYAAFDADAVELVFGKDALDKAGWRRRSPGDYIELSAKDKTEKIGPAGKVKGITLSLTPTKTGETFRKKIQDIFVDDKVPKEDRARAYYAAIGTEVLFIPVQEGIRRARWSASYRVTDATKRVILFTHFS